MDCHDYGGKPATAANPHRSFIRQSPLGNRYANAMNPFNSLRELPTQLNQPAVRDLAWTLIAAPLLLDAQWQQCHPLAGSTWAQEPATLADWLLQLDTEAHALEAWLARSSTRRLGLYYEKLWQFALNAATGVQLLAANVAIRQGAHTLGEMDLLSRDARGDHHTELACKFFLGPVDACAEDPLNWLGPGGQDRLGLKLAHLRLRQLTLSNRIEAQNVLASLGIHALQAELWLGGYLFYPWPNGCAMPRGAHPQHLRGHWLYHRQWLDFAAHNTDGRWHILPRSRWLAPARCEQASTLSLAQLTEQLHTTNDQPSPLLVAKLQCRADGDWHEVQRLFVLRNDWPSAKEPSTEVCSGPHAVQA
jgi:uncharacterized protein